MTTPPARIRNIEDAENWVRAHLADPAIKYAEGERCALEMVLAELEYRRRRNAERLAALYSPPTMAERKYIPLQHPRQENES